MSKLSDLKDEAADAGVEGYEDMTIAALEDALATPLLVGVPTEPDKANLTEAEMENAVVAGTAILPDVKPGIENLGVPTEPEKVGGATEVKPHEPLPTLPPPAHSGADIEAGIGIPTEPDRGGLNATEVKLTNSFGNTIAGKRAAAKAKADAKAAKKAAKAEAKKSPKKGAKPKANATT